MTLGHVTSGSHVGHAQWYILYYYYSKKKAAREPVAHAHAITSVTSLPVRAASDDVTSGSSLSLLLPKYDFVRADILLPSFFNRLQFPNWFTMVMPVILNSHGPNGCILSPCPALSTPLISLLFPTSFRCLFSLFVFDPCSLFIDPRITLALYNVRPIWILYVVYLWCFLYVLIVFCVVLSLDCLRLFSISHVSILPWISSS